MSRNRSVPTTVEKLFARGLRRSMQALSRLLGGPVEMQVLELLEVDAPHARSDEARAWGVRVEISGRMRGLWLLSLDDEAVHTLVDLRFAPSGADLQRSAEYRTSALQEVGNILVSSFLTGVAEVLPGPFWPSVPEVRRLGTIMEEWPEYGNHHHAFQSRVRIRFGGREWTSLVVVVLDRRDLDQARVATDEAR